MSSPFWSKLAEGPGGDNEEPNLRELNCALEALSAVFPDAQPEVFREMLCSFQEESRLQVVVDQLLKHKAKWVQGRWRVPGAHEERPRYKYRNDVLPDHGREILLQEEKFRTQSYKEAVKAALCQEFKGLSNSAIRAVLAEYNYSYPQARPTLLSLTSKSWRYSVTSFLMRRKPASPEKHPLVLWQPETAGSSRLVPRLKSTMNAELDQEVYSSFIYPLEARMRKQQEMSDIELAEQLNYTEAESQDTLYECECCFTSTTFELLSTCDEGGHYICFRCIRQSANEALYGQGWARNFDVEKASFRCLAPVMDAADGCHGVIVRNLVKRALKQGDDKDAWSKLEEKAAAETLIRTGLPLIRCPFCTYAEVNDIFYSGTRPWTRLRSTFVINPTFGNFLALYLLVFPTLLAFAWLVMGMTLLALFVSALALHSAIFESSRKRLSRKYGGSKFHCRNPRCARPSCITCLKEWRDIHTCYESEHLALRSVVERATAEAIKRTCPKCNLSFIKSSGCNKLTCVCGYQMCYICREEIGKEGYSHFCEHFRPEPGKACARCEKCDLYKTEDEEVVIRRAAAEAERRWLEKEAMAAGASYENLSRVTLAGRDKQEQQRPSFSWLPRHIKARQWEELLDRFVETALK